ncbi:hypothetical protein [Nocardioides flavescens]|uniref:Uncharacterized protein n=1 Tax=Nocardioides flavescens TaxID=2691959 RepID=A0A6L7F2X1_9ACTN|nr:hypothetical protein [Nocardioides flavescens]MXG90264.1 hypothetical protein [Nocardioides flavescens]
MSGTDSDAESDAESGVTSEEAEIDPEDEAAIAEERERRLDPDNRPDHAEVDNTDRDFDAAKGMFTDSEDYEQTDEEFSTEV